MERKAKTFCAGTGNCSQTRSHSRLCVPVLIDTTPNAWAGTSDAKESIIAIDNGALIVVSQYYYYM